MDEPLPPAIVGPICLWLLGALWLGLGLWGISVGTLIGVPLVLASPVCVALAIGWRRYDKRAWEEYRAHQEEEQVDRYG